MVLPETEYADVSLMVSTSVTLQSQPLPACAQVADGYDMRSCVCMSEQLRKPIRHDAGTLRVPLTEVSRRRVTFVAVNTRLPFAVPLRFENVIAPHAICAARNGLFTQP